MAKPLPDIIGEYVTSPERFETNGVQYNGYFEPDEIAPGQLAHFYLFLQNTLNVPLSININVRVPQSGGFLRGSKPILLVDNDNLQVELGKAEAGLLVIPVMAEHPKAGEYSLNIIPKVNMKGKAQRVRPAQARSRLDSRLIESPVGLNLVSTLGANFIEKSVKNAEFPFKISGEPQTPTGPPRLKHAYHSLWVEDNLELFQQIIHELNLRQEKLRDELTVEALYVTLYAESTLKFADVGIPLRIGEAITLPKILTYTCQLFLKNPHYYNGLLLPIWERAFEVEIDTTSALEVIRYVGYYHILKLSLAISFTLIAQAVGRQFWSLKERQAVTDFIADAIEEGQEMDVEFLYLPLLMAGTHISNKIELDDEDVYHSLALMKKARQARTDLFSDKDMAQANKIYDHILKKALQSP